VTTRLISPAVPERSRTSRGRGVPRPVGDLHAMMEQWHPRQGGL